MVFSDKIEISETNIGFEDPKIISDMVQEKEIREFELIYSLLPIQIKSKTSVEKLRTAHYSNIGGFFAMANEGVVTGHFNDIADVCYISDSLPKVDWAPPQKYEFLIGAHELAHRYLHHKRKQLGLDPVIVNARAEEGFCCALETSIRFFAFGNEDQSSIPIANGFVGRFLEPLLDPEQVIAYTKGSVMYYANIP